MAFYKSKPKRFTPVKKPKGPSNTGIFSDSSSNQKYDSRTDSSRMQSIQDYAINNHKRTSAKPDYD